MTPQCRLKTRQARMSKTIRKCCLHTFWGCRLPLLRFGSCFHLQNRFASFIFNFFWLCLSGKVSARLTTTNRQVHKSGFLAASSFLLQSELVSAWLTICNSICVHIWELLSPLPGPHSCRLFIWYNGVLGPHSKIMKRKWKYDDIKYFKNIIF